MFGLFKSSQSTPSELFQTIHTDMHAHWLPGIDDGAKTLEEALQLITSLYQMGYRKLIATPHIMQDYYKNTPAIILEKLTLVKEAVASLPFSITLEAAAEYYLDEWMLRQLQAGSPLLTFGEKYLLFETAFLNRPPFLEEAIFLMKSQGYQPVFAHPERYVYLWEDATLLDQLYTQGIHLQLNLNSLVGYYDKEAKKLAEQLLIQQRVGFVGTDCHNERHLAALQKIKKPSLLKRLAALPLLNKQI
ncbi:MAG: CpsB/CapC family capsule biosynthesis tyrosine phosphatase [Bacteroidota bacterium]